MIEILHCKYYTTSELCLKINVKLSSGARITSEGFRFSLDFSVPRFVFHFFVKGLVVYLN